MFLPTLDQKNVRFSESHCCYAKLRNSRKVYNLTNFLAYEIRRTAAAAATVRWGKLVPTFGETTAASNVGRDFNIL